MSARTAFEKLIERYSDGRPICNCGSAYYSPCGEGIKDGERRSDLLICEYGCSANTVFAKEYIAKRVLEELERP